MDREAFVSEPENSRRTTAGNSALHSRVIKWPVKQLAPEPILQDNGKGIQLNEFTATHPDSISPELPGVGKPSVRMTSWEEILRPPRPAHQSPAHATASAPKAYPSEHAATTTRTSTNWLICWLTARTRDSRQSTRKSLPWVAAYFVDGGVNAPVSVRNISLNGMFVYTNERWILGTIVRVTLNDWRLPSPDLTITLNAMAVRWGDDGVGLRFIFPKRSRGASISSDAPLVEVTPKQLKAFLEQYKGRKR